MAFRRTKTMSEYDKYNYYTYKGYRLDEKPTWSLSVDDIRLLDAAIYQIENRTTIRDAAKNYGLAKSTYHNRIYANLKLLSRELYDCVITVLCKHNGGNRY